MLAILTVLTVGTGCSSDRVHECSVGNSNDCRRSGQLGDCLAPGFCAFSDSSCSGAGLRWDSSAREDLANQCVGESTGGNDGGSANACGGTVTLAGIPGASCGVCDSGTYSCDGVDAVRCDGEATLEQNITSEGAVNASTIFSGTYPPGNSVDGELETAWFSAGPGAEVGSDSVFSWIGAQDRCIKTISIEGNGQTIFPTDFGFAQMTVEVRNSDDTVVFSKVEPLPGTPDPSTVVDTAGVVGRSVILRFSGHESSDCGGFSELNINGIL